MALAEPAEERCVLGSCPEDLLLGRPAGRRLGGLCHVGPGPAVHVAQVPQEVLHVPARAGGNRRLQASPLRGDREQIPLADEDVDVLARLHGADCSGSASRRA